MLVPPLYRLSLIAALGVALTGCSGLGRPAPVSPSARGHSSPATPARATAIASRVVVPTIKARNAHPFPAGCDSAEGVARLVTDFFDTFNRGDQDHLPRFFPEQAGRAGQAGDRHSFQWYSVTEGNPQHGGRHFVAYNRPTLLAYLAARQQHHERLQLLALDASGGSWHGGVDIGYTLSRQADDLPERMVTGKGAINCDNQTIFVWSMGSP